MDQRLQDAAHRMDQAIEALKRELAGIRSGRAHPGLVDHLRVDYFGTPTPVNQLGTVAAPEARLLTIQIWDRNAVAAVRMAIETSDLGLNPSVDGTLIRLSIPPLNEQRRKELVKLVHKKVEEGKVAVRNVRRDAHDKLRGLEKAKEITEDDTRRLTDELQKLTDRHIGDIDGVGKGKEAELLEV